MNHIVGINGKSLVFKSRLDAVATAKRSVMLGLDNVTLSTGFPGIWDDAKSIKAYANTAWFNKGHFDPDNTGDHYCDKCQVGNHPEGQDQPDPQIRQAPVW